jgi:NADH-quinone oxidoreductase subunit M
MKFIKKKFFKWVVHTTERYRRVGPASFDNPYFLLTAVLDGTVFVATTIAILWIIRLFYTEVILRTYSIFIYFMQDSQTFYSFLSRCYEKNFIIIPKAIKYIWEHKALASEKFYIHFVYLANGALANFIKLFWQEMRPVTIVVNWLLSVIIYIKPPKNPNEFACPLLDQSSIIEASSHFDFTIIQTGYYTWAGVLISVLTTYLYFIIALYYFPVRNNFIKFTAFVFFIVISEVSLYLTFLTDNFFIFYILFEFILIPFYFIVLIWGSRSTRVAASLRLVFFTLVFSLPLTVLMATNYFIDYFSFQFELLFSTLSTNSPFLQFAFYFACFLAFAVKIPLFPAHVWLPEAHGEAPTFGSVLLAGILLKLGGYGFYQVFYEFINPISNINIVSFFPLVYVISLLTIFYSNIVVFSQLDIKRTIAYYSIGHMGFVTLGLIANNQEATVGAIIIILSHGLSAAGLFFCVGYIYEQSHTRSIIAFRGLATTAPYLSAIMFFFICANISFPGTSNFIGEQIVLFGLAKNSPSLAFLPIIGVLLSGLSSFLFYIRIIFGESQENSVPVRDLNTRQIFCLSLVFLPILVFGFFPSSIIGTVANLFIYP